MTPHRCPYGHPACGVVADLKMRFGDGHETWFCREHAIRVAHAHGAEAVEKR